MSQNPGSNASFDKSWLRLYAAVAALPLVLVACGGGGGGGSSPAPAPAPVPTPSPAPAPGASLVVTPSATTASPNGAAITLNAAVTGSTGTPTWTISGPGTLSATSGTVITYTPPDSEVFDANATVTISAALTGATSQSVSISLTPVVIAGLNWTNVAVTSIGALQGIDYADGHYVAVSDAGTALASTDAATWTPITLFSSATSTDHFNARAIAHLSNTFVAVGSVSPAPYTTSASAIATSTDGVTWTMAPAPAVTTPLHGVVAGDHFVGLGESGNIYGSTDGRTWTAVTTLTGVGTLNAGAYGAGTYVAVGDAGYIAFSNGGATWGFGPTASVNKVFVNLHGVTWTGSMFVSVGDSGLIATSTDGAHWTPRTGVITGALRSVATSTGGEIVIVGDAGIETSKDGITWTSRDPAGAAALLGVTFANGRFVAVGAASAIKTSVN